MKRIALVPGSFDPITRGHLDVIRRARDLFGTCEVVVLNNREKTYRFSPEERVELVRAATAGEIGVTVTYFDGMLYEFVKTRPGAVLVKGLRSEADFPYEQLQADYNFAHCGVETVYLGAGKNLRDVSSTAVREALSKKEGWEELVPEKIVTILCSKL